MLPIETRRRARSLLDGEDAEHDDEDEWEEEEDEWDEMNNDDPVDIIVHEDVLPDPRPDGPAPR